MVTDTLRPFGTTDPDLHNMTVTDGADEMFLQTSPEYAMKQLVAQAGLSVYQICPAFRGGEIGRRHRVEFRMLEWYRVGFDLDQLADDLDRLLRFVTSVLGVDYKGIRRRSYRDLFVDPFGVNPHLANAERLRALARGRRLLHLGSKAPVEDCLDGLFSTVIEPGLRDPVIVVEYPACQAALARLKINAEGERVAERFEFYAGGVEIANAYHELRDEAALRARLTRHNRVRAARGQREIPLDEAFLASAEQMPDCAGIALGIERLMMWLLNMDELPCSG